MAVTVEAGPGGMLITRGAAVEVAFRVRGDGPAVVLLHGTSANHAVWEPVVDRLQPGARVISLDQRGHGRSGKPASGYRGPDFAGDVVVVLDALGIDRALVAGHSLGARNAWLTGALFPERVAGVLAVDYTPWVEPSMLDDLLVRVEAGNRSFDTVDDVRRYLQQRYRMLPADAVDRRARWGYRRDGEGRLAPLADPAAMRQLIDGLREPWDAEFVSVAAPMSHVRGALSRITTDSAWNAAVAARPHDRWVVDRSADHYVPEENATLVASEIEHLLSLDSEGPHGTLR
ncbi:alpha/beta hydrolase [Leifsonia shinshuensis]|uniref:alpha/beta fold hydrolase n=1 Tax=Leifsonia shinshuensis TaxID=150026 RepID=UPI001F507929|nr:alpha/beta hydrolase [Leifsonia shinshuensis]MCI0156477.1 alpha/beta hydrolase [Leifsonia shinshuensis]